MIAIQEHAAATKMNVDAAAYANKIKEFGTDNIRLRAGQDSLDKMYANKIGMCVFKYRNREI